MKKKLKKKSLKNQNKKKRNEKSKDIEDGYFINHRIEFKKRERAKRFENKSH